MTQKRESQSTPPLETVIVTDEDKKLPEWKAFEEARLRRLNAAEITKKEQEFLSFVSAKLGKTFDNLVAYVESVSLKPTVKGKHNKVVRLTDTQKTTIRNGIAAKDSPEKIAKDADCAIGNVYAMRSKFKKAAKEAKEPITSPKKSEN